MMSDEEVEVRRLLRGLVHRFEKVLDNRSAVVDPMLPRENAEYINEVNAELGRRDYDPK